MKRKSLASCVFLLLLTLVWLQFQPYSLNAVMSHWGDFFIGFRQFPHPYPLSIEKLRSPSPEEIETWKQRYKSLRPLPFPFQFAVAVPSDICGSQIPDIFLQQALLAKDGLDFTSSFFAVTFDTSNPRLSLFLGTSPLEPRQQPTKVGGVMRDSFFLLLQAYARGYVDHLHSWSAEDSRATSFIEPVELTPDSSGNVKRDLVVVPVPTTHVEGFELRIEAHKDAQFEFVLVDETKKEWRIQSPRAAGGSRDLTARTWRLSKIEPGMNSYYFMLKDLKETFPQSQNKTLEAIRFSARSLVGEKIKIETLRTFGITRDIIAEQMKTMKEFNLLPIVSTWHGGFSSWASLLHPPLEQKYNESRNSYGQIPGTPAYFADLAIDFGLIFQNHISFDRQMIFHRSEELNQIRRFDDGKPYYYSERYADVKEIESSDISYLDAFPQHAENFGSTISRFLEANSARLGETLIAYTHLDYYNPASYRQRDAKFQAFSEMGQRNSYNKETLRLLSESVYNLNDRVPLSHRGWVAPISVLSRYSAILPQAEAHTTVIDSKVQISSWQDPVSKKLVPEPRYAAQDLHGQTFYVKSSRNAEIWIDDRYEMRSFKRNPPDLTGRESVTIIDDTLPTTILGPFDPALLGVVQADTGLKTEVIPEGLVVRCVDEPCGRWNWRPFALSSEGSQYFSLDYRKPHANLGLRFSVRFNDRNAIEYRDGTAAQSLPGWDGGDSPVRDRREVLDLSDIKGKKNGVPRGKVETVEIRFDHFSAGDSVLFRSAVFLSARGLRPTSKGGFFVGGLLPAGSENDEIRLVSGSKKFAAKSRGSWFVIKNVPAGFYKISRIQNGQEFPPKNGEWLLVEKNDMETVFN